jgi:hypothetical protein
MSYSFPISPEHGVVRNNTNDGWYVVPVKSGVSPKPFFDAAYENNSERSYAAAKKHNATLRPYKAGIRNQQVNPSTKANQELPVGITLAKRTTLNRGGKGTQQRYTFKVTLIGGGSVNVYIGTARTYQQNYGKALEKAISLRETSKKALLKSPDE